MKNKRYYNYQKKSVLQIRSINQPISLLYKISNKSLLSPISMAQTRTQDLFDTILIDYDRDQRSYHTDDQNDDSQKEFPVINVQQSRYHHPNPFDNQDSSQFEGLKKSKSSTRAAKTINHLQSQQSDIGGHFSHSRITPQNHSSFSQDSKNRQKKKQKKIHKQIKPKQKNTNHKQSHKNILNPNQKVILNKTKIKPINDLKKSNEIVNNDIKPLAYFELNQVIKEQNLLNQIPKSSKQVNLQQMRSQDKEKNFGNVKKSADLINPERMRSQDQEKDNSSNRHGYNFNSDRQRITQLNLKTLKKLIGGKLTSHNFPNLFRDFMIDRLKQLQIEHNFSSNTWMTIKSYAEWVQESQLTQKEIRNIFNHKVIYKRIDDSNGLGSNFKKRQRLTNQQTEFLIFLYKEACKINFRSSQRQTIRIINKSSSPMTKYLDKFGYRQFKTLLKKGKKKYPQAWQSYFDKTQ